MMFKNQLQELAQRSCFNLPSYTSTREGPDHAPRFKASVNFNGEIFDSPSYCTTLRQAEHAAAEVALNALSSSGPSRSLTARVLDETGVYKNLLQETAHRAGLNLPIYTTVRSGPGHLPVFTSSVELAGRSFVGESAKTKKQAEKNAAIAAWSALKTMPNLNSLSKESEVREGRDQMMTLARSVPSAWPKDESSSSSSSRVIRKKHQNHQSRRRLWRNSRDNNNNNNNVSCSSSSSSNNKDTEQQQWKLMDLFMDFTREGVSTEKHNWFASLLPPPPPRTTSKILPPPTLQDLLKSKQIPLETTSNYSQLIGKTQDHHPKLQVKWLNQEKEGSTSSISSLIDNPIPVTTSEQRTKVNINIPIAPPPIKLGPVGSGRQSYGGRYAYNHNPQRIAPAVQIRSVIPVCSAPPQTMRASSSSIGGSSSSSAVKEVSLPRANASLPNQTGRPDGTQPPELSSSFRKLRL